MSLALPLFAGLTKASKDVLYGTVQGEGAFTSGAQVKAQTVTADGVILNASSQVLLPQGLCAPTLTLMATPQNSLMLMGIIGPAGTLTGSVTASNVFNQPGLQATLTATPPVLGQAAAASASLTLDYTTPYARVRALLSPSDPFNLLQSSVRPRAELSATTAFGPCMLGGRVAADSSSGRLSQWSVGLNYTRMTAASEDQGKEGVERLSGQQWGVIINDTTAGSGAQGHSATCSVHQLLSGGKASLAAEYTLPLHPVGSNAPEEAYELSLGAAKRLDTGGLVKARVKHNGQLALLYQQAVGGLGQLSLTCTLDPLRLDKVAPSLGLSLTL